MDWAIRKLANKVRGRHTEKIFNLTIIKKIKINETKRSCFHLLYWKIYMTILKADVGKNSVIHMKTCKYIHII